MKALRTLICAGAVTLAACAGVNTRVVQINTTHTFPPTQSVEVLLQKPERPHIEIALLEAEGYSEVDLLNDAREKAKTLGADAIVRRELDRVYHAPMTVYDPWPDPFYFHYRRFGPYPYYDWPFWSPYRTVGGGYTYVLKAVAIKYTEPPG